jgi:rsbT antagonist protein RsbS
MARLRGAVTVIVGIQPEVAFAMVQLGMGTGTSQTPTAPDLEEGLAHLAEQGVIDITGPAYRAWTPIPTTHDADPDRNFRSSRADGA